MASFLLEIGTEELPADFVRLALPQLEHQLQEDLAALRLPHTSLRAMGTPRRLAVVVEGLPDHQADSLEDRKGPPAQQAFRDGLPTAAAEGFARRCGVGVDQLEVRDTAKGPFVFALMRERGRPTAEVLADRIPGWIWSLQGRRFMRWGQGEGRFSRPVRWLVALLDGEQIPVRLVGCDPPMDSGRWSRGHRLQPESLAIPSAEAYVDTLQTAGVLVDRRARAATIMRQLAAAAARDGALLDLPDALYEELVDLVEEPRVIEGGIDANFLSLPPEVLRTVMRAHQRYVPLLRADAPHDPLSLSAEAALFPRFLCVSNGVPGAEDTVRRGNERVLRARLADATFFLHADFAVASIDRREALARVTFAEGLGSLRDRTERLEWCTDVLLGALGLTGETVNQARRAAHLCKHDLVSQMVGEFPELQGIMGAKYLLHEGESRPVALAVLEHYLPRFTGDDLPTSQPGGVLALAERLELLLSIFSKGERPTGSSDPYGLRRAGNGFIQIFWHHHWELDVPALLVRAAQEWQAQLPQLMVDAEKLATDLAEFLRQRINSLLEEEGFDPDIVQAIQGRLNGSRERLLRGICDAKNRATLLRSLREQGRLVNIQAVAQRASRLAEKGKLPMDVLRVDGVIDSTLFERKSEADFLQILKELTPLAESDRSYAELAHRLADSAATLNEFFDGPNSVMVMCENEGKRNNRLNLLAVFRNQANVLADFDRLVN
ncbi:MAG: glycine--tRNA ligase subunit beta [Cyanobacteriota bacterium]